MRSHAREGSVSKAGEFERRNGEEAREGSSMGRRGLLGQEKIRQMWGAKLLKALVRRFFNQMQNLGL